jgi:predicted nucleic acid-binding protein
MNLIFCKVYGQIITTPEIANEYGEPLPEWVEIITVSDKYRQQILEIQIDRGESSAIALAMERLGIIFTGTIGVIIKAKQKGIISSIIPILEKIKKTDFRIPADIELQALKEANE